MGKSLHTWRISDIARQTHRQAHCHHFAWAHGYWAEPDMGSDNYLSLKNFGVTRKKATCHEKQINHCQDSVQGGQAFLCCDLFLSHASDVIMVRGKGFFRRWCVPWLIRRVEFLTSNIDPWSHLVGNRAHLLWVEGLYQKSASLRHIRLDPFNVN